MRNVPLLLTLGLAALISGSWPSDTVRLEDLDRAPIRQGWGKPQKAKSVTEKPLSIGGRTFEHGLGTHAESECWIALNGGTKRFRAQVGVDDAAGNAKASLEFAVYGDGKPLWQSGVCRLGQPPRACEVDTKGIRTLLLLVRDAGDGVEFDHADWADAVFEFDGVKPKIIGAPREDAVILTPPAPPAPRINGPKVYGVRPGSPFLYRIPATGVRPMRFTAKGLPPGLTLDPSTGIITGRVESAGEFRATLTARNARGSDRRAFRIVAGPTLALTPPMGWNSWYIHYHRVSDRVMRQAADAMVASGMADHGYQYVNIDDCWMVKVGSSDPEVGGAARGPDGTLSPNRRFPDMKGLTDYIHNKGLKAGIYISPGPRTCAGYEGSWKHEEQDARTFAGWGFDFLKCDWCSYTEVAGGNSLEHLKKPYRLMGDALKKLDRDIVFNLCQYGMGKVWEWGGEVGGHCWRTTGDLGLEGGSLSRGIYQVGLFNSGLTGHARPGQWNDPDYLLIGWVGEASQMGEGRPTSLTPNEQYSHMSLWALMAAPLVFSGDMSRLDPFTLNVLCNREVIDVDQDPLGKQARVVRRTSDTLVLEKTLEDGSRAVGLFSLGPMGGRIRVTWAELGLKQPQKVRDLWRQKELGMFADGFETELARHGVRLVRVRR